MKLAFTFLSYLYSFCLISFVAISQNAQEVSAIKGNFVLDTTLWESKAYLSHIPTFNEMYTISKDMIIAETSIDSNGDFEFSTNYFPEREQLYRIHFSKKGTPVASLIIGGPEENHFFVIASKTKGVSLQGYSDQFPFSKVAVLHSPATGWLKQVDLIASYVDSTQHAGSQLKREFIATGVHEKLRNLADTLSEPLPSLYALYRSNYRQHAIERPDFYKAYLKKWKKEDSAYFTIFRKELPIQKEISPLWIYSLLGIFFFLMGIYVTKWHLKKNHKASKKLQKLSVQERKIFDLIKSGFSNKEISEQHNIGVSTVKSHVSNIYGKLHIKSRKEAMDY
ncbi:LuxR C-terminal-related transcriptional regulator [Dokdonia sp.]|uniref:LuxR C-terminal-related transcriptional regulator n=1 Tax=Dokdonia sp. TaxID=2024995 RepID=UPI003263C7C2